MAKNGGLQGAYKFYLDGKILPQTPEKLTVEYPDNTEEIRLANGENFTIPRRDSPIKFSFEFDLTSDYYEYYQWYGDTGVYQDHKQWANWLWEIKHDKRPVSFFVDRGDLYPIIQTVIVGDWSWVEDATRNDDYRVSITLIQYFPQTNIETNEDIQHHLVRNKNARGWTSRGM